MPSEILPKIASGPITKIKDADTNPSTKLELLFLANLSLNLMPRFSNRSSNLIQFPIIAPPNNENTITSIGQPSGIAL